MRKCIVEFIGTFFLVLAIGLTGNPLAIGLMLMAMVYVGGHISGAHYNPAVSLAAMIMGTIKKRVLLAYWAVQLLAGFVASFLIFFLVGVQFMPSPAENVGIHQALIVEIAFTFVLALVILTVTSSRDFGKNHIYGLAIGLTLSSIAFAGSSISGGVYNPAVGLGSTLFDYLLNGRLVDYYWIYILGPFIGAILAAITFKYLNSRS